MNWLIAEQPAEPVEGRALKPVVEFSVLASPLDVDFLEATVRHQLRAFANSASIGHRVLVIDDRPHLAPLSMAQFLSIVERLAAEASIDEVRSIDWEAARVAEASGRWFGAADTPTHAGARARYQYVFSIESATSDLVMHVDSDMLFHGDLGAWVDDAVGRLDAHDSAVAVIPDAAIPQATSGREWVLGRRADHPSYPSGWSVGTDFTSRAFLMDRRRVRGEALPLDRLLDDEQWEASLAQSVATNGLTVHSLLGIDAWMMHPHKHNRAHRVFLPSLISEIERGRYPYRRWGYPWDITTEGRRFVPWLPRLLARAALGRRPESGGRAEPITPAR